MFKKLGIPALITGVFLALSPTSALAAEHGHHEGGRGHGEVHGERGRGFRGGPRHEDRFRGGHNEHGRFYGGNFWGGPGYSFGYYGAPYAYGYEPGYYSNPDYFNNPYPCYPGGYYDQYGVWVPAPNCAAPAPYGY